tara:strand:+ start:298 stop:903 length:606 start_codon:yes stop_codon:yes gene_type:complete
MAFISTTPITELEAINIMLAAIGEAAVSSLETATTVEVTQAKNLLSNINREVQQKGWHFNTEWDVSLSRDADNRVPIGSSVLSVYVENELTTIRGIAGQMFLYDLDNNTFTWTKNLTKAVTITLLDFQNTPQSLRQYITARASRVFQEEVIGQVSAEQINRQEEQEAYADLLDDEAERAGFNVGFGTLDMQNTLKTYRKLW